MDVRGSHQNIVSYLNDVEMRYSMADVFTTARDGKKKISLTPEIDEDLFHALVHTPSPDAGKFKYLRGSFLENARFELKTIAMKMKEIASLPRDHVQEEKVKELEARFLVLKENLDCTFAEAPDDKKVDFFLYKSTDGLVWSEPLKADESVTASRDRLACQLINNLAVPIIAAIFNVYPHPDIIGCMESDPLPMRTDGAKATLLGASQQIDMREWIKLGFQYQPFLESGKETDFMVCAYKLNTEGRWYFSRLRYILSTE